MMRSTTTTLVICLTVVYIFCNVNLVCMLYAKLFDSELATRLGLASRTGDWVIGETICPALGRMYGGSTEAHYALWGTALPVLLLAAVAYVWPKKKETHTTTASIETTPSSRSRGDVAVQFWSTFWVWIPCLYLVYLGVVTDPSSLLRLGSVLLEILLLQVFLAGDVAVLALSFFLIPVAKHSVILEWLHMDATHALVFHRVAGWVSFAFTMLHGVAFLIVYGLRGLDEGFFWRSMWHSVMPPPKCWSIDILLLGIDDGNATTSNIQDFPPTEIHSSRDCQGYYLNFTGLVSMLGFIALAITSLSFVRRKYYRIFYNVHILGGWAMMLGALLHFPTVGAFMLPGMLYYLVATVPVWVQQWWRSSASRQTSSSLRRIRHINDSGDCYELEFARRRRHDDTTPLHAFCKLCVPHVSWQWHPFSVIAVDDSVRILFRATGPFTKATAEYLTNDSSSSTPRGPPKVLMDAFYAEGCGWLDSCEQHDSIVMVAGGVGIVPFLSFVPSLMEQLLLLSTTTRCCSVVETTVDGNETTRLLHKTAKKKQVILHWYCRESGLTRYVLHEYIRGDLWSQQIGNLENETAISLQVVVHITSGDVTSVFEVDDAEAPGSQIPQLYDDTVFSKDSKATPPLETAHWNRKARKGWVLSASLMLLALVIHWWQFFVVTADRRSETSIRILGLIITAVVAAVVAFCGEWIMSRWQKLSPAAAASRPEQHSEPPLRSASVCGDVAVQIKAGRPSSEDVIGCLVTSKSPALYLCGPLQLRESIKTAIKEQQIQHHAGDKGCVIYENLSEM